MNQVYLFKQAVSFGKEMTYFKGTHAVPEQVVKHPYFQKLLKVGLVSLGGVGALVKAPTVLDGQKKAVASAKDQAVQKLSQPEVAPSSSSESKKSKK